MSVYFSCFTISGGKPMISLYLSMVETDKDRDKVTYIYENFYSFMAYTAAQVLGNKKYDIEDAVHNAMIKIIENLDFIDFSDPIRAKNLCGIIAKNKARDYLKRKESRLLPIDETVLSLEDDGDDPSEFVIRKDIYDTVLRAIESMSETYKEVCFLKYINGLKEKEIAALLDLNPDTVSVRIYRGRRLIKEALGKENFNV